MMDKRFQPHELKLLSAYMDGELDPSQRQKMETRLENDPALREKLKDIRRTRLTLSSLQRLKAPRNFTLTPEMVAVRRRKRTPASTALKLASAVAGVLLVFLVAVDILWGGFYAASPMEMPASVADSDTFTAETTAEPLIIWGDTEANDASGLGGGDRTSSTGPEYMEEVEEESEEMVEVEEEEEDTQTLLEEEAISPQEEGSKSAEESPILGLNPDDAGEVIEQSDSLTTEYEGSAEKSPSTLRWIEIALSAVVVGGLITLWVLRKK